MNRGANNVGCLVVALAAVGCGGSADPGIGDAGVRLDGSSAPAVQVGSGETEFVELTPGAEVELILGPQGGAHIWISVRTVGLRPDRVMIDYGARDADTGESVTIENLRQPADLRPGPDGYEWPGLLGFLDRPPEDVAGRTLVLWAAVTDQDDVMVEGEATARAAETGPFGPPDMSPGLDLSPAAPADASPTALDPDGGPGPDLTTPGR